MSASDHRLAGPELVGRAALLTRIRFALADRGGVLLLGPAGIGKRVLLRALGEDSRVGGETFCSAARPPPRSPKPVLTVGRR
ncbi:hypothetical protein ACH4OY_31475 [Micromonospora rubida]|uniref:Orc1-like AAA ATPase domain-containing protein n=1 Tax=Micromonospora rubida TaxID=2697657 RepID=A0ABW7STW0_9ACTN